MEDYGKIKMQLLKSGLPLESMVADCIDSLSGKLRRPLLNHGEYFFERAEASFPLSVDFLVTHDLDITDCDFLQIAFLIECKYCTRGAGWYFMENPMKDAGEEFFVQNFFTKGKVSTRNFPVLVPPLNDSKIPVVGRGTEIYSNGDRNEKTITEGVHQLMFACCASLMRAFIKEEDTYKTYLENRKIDIKNRSIHSLLCPVLVTTVDLHVLSKPTIDKVEQSTKIEEISGCEELVVYSTPKPPLYVGRYVRETLSENIKFMFSTDLERTRALTYLTRMTILNPSRYYILNYHYLETFLKGYIDLASSMLSYACKKVN